VKPALALTVAAATARTVHEPTAAAVTTPVALFTVHCAVPETAIE
jgi:hypothetical protein